MLRRRIDAQNFAGWFASRRSVERPLDDKTVTASHD
jgi:hypothetical protein